MEKLYSPTAIKAICRRHGLAPSKSLGQNFIADKHAIDRVIDCAGLGPGDLAIEIGPGLGALTAAAAEAASRVVAIEIDSRLMPALQGSLSGYGNVALLNADVLKTDVRAIADGWAGRVKVIGNLPYYITSPIIMKLLEDAVPAESMTFMVQKEVAARISADPGSPGCGAITAAVRYYCQPRIAAHVSRDVFIPRPNVDSCVVRLDVRQEKDVRPASESMFFSAIRCGFGKRRKTLHNSLTGMEGLSKPEAGQALADAGIDPTRRAETLSLQEFADVADSALRIIEGRGRRDGAI
jgi:16S rRNA (adenine1518-N6/adenine1519-N6)-dimethyltransferase